MKRVFSAKYRVLAGLTSFLLKNAFKRRETDSVNKMRFWREITRFSASNVVFAEKRISTQGNACFSVS